MGTNIQVDTYSSLHTVQYCTKIRSWFYSYSGKSWHFFSYSHYNRILQNVTEEFILISSNTSPRRPHSPPNRSAFEIQFRISNLCLSRGVYLLIYYHSVLPRLSASCCRLSAVSICRGSRLEARRPIEIGE